MQRNIIFVDCICWQPRIMLNAEIIEMLLTDDGAKVTVAKKRQTGGGVLRK